MCDVSKCPKPGTVMVEGGHVLCDDHSVPKKYICRHCSVQMVDKYDHRPILGRSHGKSCPRRRLLG